MGTKILIIMAYLLLLVNITALASAESSNPEGNVAEVKQQEELASVVGGLNWSGNDSSYVKVPTYSMDNSTPFINMSTNYTQRRNLTEDEPWIGDDKRTGTVAPRCVPVGTVSMFA